MQYLTLFFRLFLRPLRREPARSCLTVLAVALGVAVVLAIELAGDAAAGSFQSSLETLTGNADFEVTSTGGVPPAIVARLATLPYALQIHPRIEDYAVIAGRNRTVPLLGLDLLNERLPGGNAPTGVSTQTVEAFQQDNSAWVSKGLGYKAGDRIPLLVNDRSVEIAVRGVLSGDLGGLIVMDLAPATRLLGRNGNLDLILIDTPRGRPLEQWGKILREALPTGMTLTPYGARTEENRRMLAAFRWNLRVLSYIALVVGAFLIYNTISVSVVRRRAEIGVLRALGATRVSVLGAFLAEAATFGLLGGIAGIALGRLMAESAVQMVAATVESLYVSSRPGPIDLSWRIVLFAVLTGIGIAVFSALAPAWEASRVVPIDAMARGRREHSARVHRLRNLGFAAFLGVFAWIASQQPPIGGKPLFGYLAAILLIAASALAIPALVSGLSTRIAGALRRIFGVEALLASRSLAGSLRRTSVLVGALATAIAMLTAVGIMVGSFRQTVILWMGDRLRADLYLRPAVPPAPDRHPTIAAGVADRLAGLPQVAALDRFRAYEITYQGAPVTLGGGDARVMARYTRQAFLSGAEPKSIFDRMLHADAVVVSEPFANKHRIHSGDTLQLPLAGHIVPFRVIDIYYDYSNERGFIVMDRGTLLKYLPDPSPSNIAIYLRPGVTLSQGRRAVESALGGRKVLIDSNRSLREQGIKIFDRTFAITYALEAVAVIVAVMGVAGALLTLVIDRRREFGLLQFLGGARGQIRRMILFEAGLLGFFANVAGLVLGILLSLLLIYVINKQSFGWTIQFHWPIAILLAAFLIVDLATIVAGLYPARIATRLNPIEVIHEE